ncbi:uncharacterized protein LOC105221487 [Zeugodacus cucurbitae]|uniref:uncharacterized protein LOC105221487 n=1 Tax=Zeugodacus cucurbitae TaxID=28588 RepID=UPI000596AA17|nr:uncharacterized protein LOC105221487 [Zeugodacus cucurbitae]
MRVHLVFSAFVFALICNTLPAEGKRVSLVPLSASEVYRLLREAGQEDAVPEGRVVTQGIAAVSGFAVGLAKGIGGSLLFDLATSLLSANNTQTNNQTMEPQEVCFSSRSLYEINDSGDEDPEGRQNGADALTSADYSDYENSNPVRSEVSSPSTSNDDSDYGDNELIRDGDDTKTGTVTSTDTGPAESINCVLVQRR